MTIQPAFDMPSRMATTPASPVPTPPPTPGPQPFIRPDVAAEKYRQLRDRVKEISAKHAEELKPYKDAMTQLENSLLDALNTSGANSIKTSAGTVYRSVRTTYSVSDPHELRKWVEENNRPDFYENRISNEAITNHVAEGKPLPPGVKVSTFTQVNVRK